MPLVVRAVLLAAVVLALALPAAASAAPPAGFVGMTADDLYGNGGPYRDKALTQQQAAGVQLLRVTFHWNVIELAPNNFDFALYDTYVLDAAKHNITFLPVLFNAPKLLLEEASGVRVLPSSLATTPTWPAGRACWLTATAPTARSGRANPAVTPRPITAWQIWNEPNLKLYWPPKSNARQYLEHAPHRRAPPSKAKDPNAEIVTAGMPDSRLSSAIRLAPYLKSLYKGGGTSAFDTLAINSYAVSPKFLGKLMNTTRKLANRIGGRSDKLWITEVGWCDKGYKPGHRFCVGTKRQAKYTGGALTVMKRNRRAWKLRGFVWFSWRDGRPYTSRDFWGNHTGLLTIRGRKKPAFNAFARGVKRF